MKTLRIDQQNLLDSHIIELDLAAAVASPVDKDLIQLRSFYLGDDRDAEKTIRCIRPLLENFIRKMAPDKCPPGNGWLGTFIGDITKAAAGDPLAIFHAIVDDLDHLNTYTSPYAHDSGMCPAINDAELKTSATMTLKLMGRI